MIKPSEQAVLANLAGKKTLQAATDKIRRLL